MREEEFASWLAEAYRTKDVTHLEVRPQPISSGLTPGYFM